MLPREDARASKWPLVAARSVFVFREVLVSGDRAGAADTRPTPMPAWVSSGRDSPQAAADAYRIELASPPAGGQQTCQWTGAPQPSHLCIPDRACFPARWWPTDLPMDWDTPTQPSLLASEQQPHRQLVRCVVARWNAGHAAVCLPICLVRRETMPTPTCPSPAATNHCTQCPVATCTHSPQQPLPWHATLPGRSDWYWTKSCTVAVHGWQHSNGGTPKKFAIGDSDERKGIRGRA